MPYWKVMTVVGVCSLAFLVATALAADSPKSGEKTPVRVALVTAANVSPETKSLLDLATVELSRLENVELLERAEVLRVLVEQKLTLTGLASDQHALAVGKLLKADVFVCLETDAQNHQAFAATAFDANTGVRLRETPLESKVDAVAKRLTDFVKRSLEKRRLGKDLKTVGFVSVRNADLSRDWDVRCQAIGRLLERRVLGTDGVTVLERRRLENVTRERTLAVEESERALLASVILIDLQVARGTAAKGLKVSAQLKTLDGKVLKTLTVECESADAILAAEKLFPKLMEGLDQPLKPSPRPAPEDEAEHFAQEGFVLIGQQLELPAITALETAIALAPDRMDYHLLLQAALLKQTEKILSEQLQQSRDNTKRLSGSPLADVLSFLRSALEVRRVLVERQRRPDVNPVEVVVGQYRTIQVHQIGHRSFAGVWWRLRNFTIDDHDALAEVRELRALFRELVLGSLAAHQAYARQHPEALANYTVELEMAIRLAGAWCGNAAEMARDINVMVRPWLKVVAENKSRPAQLNRAGHLTDILRHIPLPVESGPSLFWYSAEATPDLLALATEMGNHPDPLIRIWGPFVNDLIRRESQAVDDQMDAVAWTLWKKNVRALLSTPEFVADRVARGSLYELWSTAIYVRTKRPKPPMGPADWTAIRSWTATEQLELWVEMADRQEVFLNPTVGIYEFHADQRETAIATLERLQGALPRIPPELREVSSDEIRRRLEEQKRRLIEQRPVGLKKPAEPNGITFKELYSASGSAAREMRAGPLTHPIVQEGIAYCTSWGLPLNATKEPNVSAVKLIAQPLNGDPPRLISECPLSRPPQLPSGKLWGVVKTTAMTEREYIVIIEGVGAVLLPLKAGELRIVGTSAGLPSDEVQTADVLGDRLILSLKGGYLVEYDLKTRSLITLVSAQRKLSESPLDNGSDLQVMMVIADPKRSRVVLSVWMDAKDERDSARCGFWAMNLKTRQWTQLLSIPGWNRFGFLCDREGDSVLLRQNGMVLNFDLQKDELTAVQTDGLANGFSKSFTLQAGRRSANFIGHEDYALIDGWLWSVRGQRLRLKDQTVEDVPGWNQEPRFPGLLLTRVPNRPAILVSGRTSLVLYQQSPP